MIEVRCSGVATGNPGPAAYGAILYVDGDMEWAERFKLGSQTVSYAEYMAVLLGMTILIKKGHLIRATILTGSPIIIGQLTENWKVISHNLKPLVKKAQNFMELFDKVELLIMDDPHNQEVHFYVRELLDKETPLHE